MKVIQLENPELLFAQFESLAYQIKQLEKHLQPKQPTKLMTRSEVKDFFSITLLTVTNWTKQGILKSYKIGNRVYYKRVEIESALTSMENHKNRNQ